MSNHKDQEGKCPLTTVLGLATDTAKAELGTDADNKRVRTTACLTTAVTENSSTTTKTVDASVSLGVHSKTEPAADEGCCCHPSTPAPAPTPAPTK